MRLLSASTLQFREFHGSKVPYYAILSHTWGEEEVSFQDMQTGSHEEKAGFAKIKCCCALAASEGWEYVWVDTCCIDKTSSAELSEAINSMFDWYRGAQVCYAYLADVASSYVDHYDPDSAFRQSRWFTRGWTLQELLAPATVVFFNQEWVELGTKSSLLDAISATTRIIYSDVKDFKDANVAVKMSWASSRETTRVEDTAYCLLGLFGVNMPLLYGEGRNAFIRLQLEITRISDDETIFAWDSPFAMDTGLLAPSPVEFRNSGDIRQITFDKRRTEYSMTNKGLRLTLLLLKQNVQQMTQHQGASRDLYLAPLNCTRGHEGHPLAIYLKKNAEQTGSKINGFARCCPRSGASLTTLKLGQKLRVSESVRDIKHASTAKDQIGPFELKQSTRHAEATALIQSAHSKSGHLLESMQRHTVYVKQLESYTGSTAAYRPRRFVIKYPSPQCTISEVRLRSGLAGWEEGESGECVIWLDNTDEAAFIVFDFSFPFSSIDGGRCPILLRKFSDDSAGIYVLDNSRKRNLLESLASFKKQMRTGLPKDRVSIFLRYDVSLSAKLRLEVISGEKQFAVTLYFDRSEKRFQWPSKAILATANHADDQENKILDQIQGYVPLRPS